MELPFDPAIPLLGLYSKNPETPIQKNPCTPMLIAAQFTITKCWKQPKCPSVNEWIKKLWYIYIMEFSAALKKKEILVSFCGSMDIMLSEINSQRKTDNMISLICGI